MSTFAYMVFPATGVKTGLENVLHSVSNFITKKFPHGTIKYTMIDTKDKMKSFYKELVANNDAPTNKIAEIRKIPRPHAYLGYTYPNFNTEDSGLGTHPLYLYPAEYFDSSMLSYFPFFLDKERGIEIRSSNVRVKVEAEVVFTCQSKEEQVTLYTYLINFIKVFYGYRLNYIKTEYIMPSSLIRSVKNIIFGEGKKTSEVIDDLDKYLNIGSVGGINPRYKNGKKDDQFYGLEYLYNTIYFQLSNKPEMDDGEKKNDVYDNYTVRFPIFIELYLPINYILKVPELVSGINSVNQIGDFIKMSSNADEDCNDQIMQIVKDRDDRDMNRSFIDYNSLKLLASADFLLSSPQDVVNTLDWFPDIDKSVFNAATAIERKEIYEVYYYENGLLLDSHNVTIDDSFVATITGGSLKASQMVEIYRNTDAFNKYKSKYNL